MSRRRGIARGQLTGTGLLNKGRKWTFMAEVVELERLGSASKIEVVSVSGVDRSTQRLAKEILDGWQPTDDIEWEDEKPA